MNSIDKSSQISFDDGEKIAFHQKIQLQALLHNNPYAQSITIYVPIVLSQNWNKQTFKAISNAYRKYGFVIKQRILLHFMILPYYYSQKEPQSNIQTSHLVETLKKNNITTIQYERGAVGGTFDYLHPGHMLLLLFCALSVKEQLVIGITGPSLLTKKKNGMLIQSYERRSEIVQKYLKKLRPELTISITKLDDPYGPTIHRAQLEVLIVSEETRSGGDAINKIRNEKQMKPMDLIVCPALGQDDKILQKETLNEKISSSSIRQYLLDKNSFTVQQFFEYKSFWEKTRTEFESFFKIEREQVWTIWFERLFELYSQYWRHYHTNYHIYTLFKQYEKLKSQHPNILDQQSQALLYLGIFFHDAIYIPNKKYNEQLSAQLFQKFIREIVQEAKAPIDLSQFAKKVSKAILSTKTHKQFQQPIDEKTLLAIRILNDIDMSILNSPSQYYRTYSEQIQLEYGPIFASHKNYAEKRIEFLNSTKDSKIFQSKYFEQNNTELNRQWEIKKLIFEIEQI